MRTLVISDLHIGQPGGTAVLERPEPLRILTETLAGFDRLVLLGDTVEMTEGTWSHSASAAAPILRQLGGAISSVIVVPGNHDHRLVQRWVQRRGQRLERESIVPEDASPELAEMIGWLSAGGAQVEVHYPGIWLTETVWATHGHYLNHFLRPVASVGLHSKKYRATPPQAMRPDQFEHIIYDEQKPELAEGPPPRRWHDKLLPKRIAPVVSWALDLQVRRHALPSFSRVVAALGVGGGAVGGAGAVDGAEAAGANGAIGGAGAAGAAGTAGAADGASLARGAEYAVFGHIHRFGPLPLDNPREWRTTPSTGIDVALLNTGSWRYEPILLAGADAHHPYWPGGSIQIGDDGIPRAVNLLSELAAEELR